MKKVMMKTVLASLVVSSITVLTGCVTSPDMEAAKQPLGSIVSVVNVPRLKRMHFTVVPKFGLQRSSLILTA